jgi:hypothetical protein
VELWGPDLSGFSVPSGGASDLNIKASWVLGLGFLSLGSVVMPCAVPASPCRGHICYLLLRCSPATLLCCLHQATWLVSGPWQQHTASQGHDSTCIQTDKNTVSACHTQLNCMVFSECMTVYLQDTPCNPMRGKHTCHLSVSACCTYSMHLPVPYLRTSLLCTTAWYSRQGTLMREHKSPQLIPSSLSEC